jgi:hypothetical protein
MIQSLVHEFSTFCVFSFGPWWPSQKSDWKFGLGNLVCELPSGTYVQSFGSIAPAVTKRALLTGDDNGHHVITQAHQVSQKWCCKGASPNCFRIKCVSNEMKQI